MNTRAHERQVCPKHNQTFFTECLRCRLEKLRDAERPAQYATPELDKQLWLQQDRPETLEHPCDAPAPNAVTGCDPFLPQSVVRALERIAGWIIFWALGYFGIRLILAFLQGKIV